MINPFYSLYIVMLWLVGIGVFAGCTTEDALYCHEPTHPCPAGQQCDEQTHTCIAQVPVGDAHLEGPRDLKPLDQPVIDSGPDDSAIPDGPRSLGEPCNTDNVCQSGSCVDGVCCNGPCPGTCRSCALPDTRGQCTLIPTGEDPDLDCPGEHLACAGSCNGEGECSYPGESTTCSATTCQNGVLEHHRCNMTGACIAASEDCGGYVCAANGSACQSSCGSTSECTGTFQCLDKQCINQLDLGESCGTNDLACSSTHCVDGVCCSAASCAVCQRCDLPGSEKGTCSPVLDGESCGATTCQDGVKNEPRCSGGACGNQIVSCGLYRCNAGNTGCLVACGKDEDCADGAYCASTVCLAKKSNGQSCLLDGECLSDLCTSKEKVCCDTECGGECESCSGQTSCSPKPKGTLCGAQQQYCDNQPWSSAIKVDQCDGQRNCKAEISIICDPYRCIPSGDPSCPNSCTEHSQCTSHLCDLHDNKNTCPTVNQICYVSKSGGCPGGGTHLFPYCLIQDCIDSGKSYVAIADGTYAENLTIAADVRLIAQGTQGSILKIPQNTKVIIQPPAVDTTGITINGMCKVWLYGLSLQHQLPSNPPSSSDPSGLLIGYHSSSTINIHSCWLHQANKSHCLWATKGVMKIEDTVVESCGLRGISAEATNLTLSQVRLSKNGSDAIKHESAPLTMQDVTISENVAGLLTYNSVVSLQRVVAAKNEGHGLSLESSTTGDVFNVAAYENKGAAINLQGNDKPLHLFNLTLANNWGKELVCEQSATIYNSILWTDPGVTPYSGLCTFSHCDVRGGVSGTNNINADPQFVGNPLVYHPYEIQSFSPCVDVGLDAVPGVAVMPDTDLRGKYRLVDKKVGGRIIDIGAYEVQ